MLVHCKACDYGKTMDMDYILEKGDELYKSLNVHTPLNIDELPKHVNIEGCLLTVRLLSQQQGNISNNVINDFLKVSYQETLNTGNVLLFFINGYTFALVWRKQGFFLFDLHSRSYEDFIALDGYSILIKFISVDEVQNYIREVYLLQQNNSSLYYQFQYISIDVTESDITVTTQV